MSSDSRDNFTEKTKLQIAKRAGWLCSDPSCRCPTVGSNSDGDGEINLGVAAHICAAAPNGPRYDPGMTSEQRKSPDNGIWLCQRHGKAVDSKDSEFSVAVLREWKEQAQKESWRRVLYNDIPHGLVAPKLSESELGSRLHAATIADLEIFQRSHKWPSTGVALMHEVDGLGEPVSTSALATVLTTLDDLIIIAPPGMGKTTTLFQVAKAVLESGNASPIVILLSEWSVDRTPLLEFILKRPAFKEVSENDFRTVAAKPGVILLLDGWNELDSIARDCMAAQVSRLQLELPELNLLISTRKQALDVPISGKHVTLLPLSKTQQLSIACELRGDAGEGLVDQAWRTPGVRELITIPLYLTVLLTLPEGAPFPTTKEEVLRRFVASHEKENQRASALAQMTHGLHQRFLEGLAVTAMHTANTVIEGSVARRSIFETGATLVTEAQITEKPQPDVVLETFVDHHVLVRTGDPESYSYQHQQFQEWYASHFVERLMFMGVINSVSYETLKADILNQHAWEEAILFACERMARGDEKQQKVCAAAILAAFDVDPILAAEMIYHSTNAVWTHIDSRIQDLIARWHTPGKIDRALHFMVTSGREEFLKKVWPLITHENDQIHLAALRAGKCFRPSILGNDAVQKIGALSPKLRQNILHEIAYNSDMDGLDLAVTAAKADSDPEVKASVVSALIFRHAKRHIAYLLRDADEKTFDLLVRENLLDDVTDEAVETRLAAARERLHQQRTHAYDQISSLIYGQPDKKKSAELATIISEMEIDDEQKGAVSLIYQAKERFPRAVAEGILSRVRKGLALPYQASELMAGSGFAFEDEDLFNISLDTNRFDNRANAAASVLGPRAVGRLIDSMLVHKEQLLDTQGKYNQEAADCYHAIQNRIGFTQTESLLSAIAARSEKANNPEMAGLADLISRHPNEITRRGRSFDAASRSVIAEFIESWGNRLLDSSDSTRAELASIAALACRVPSVNLLPLLKRLLDTDLDRWQTFQEQAHANHYRRDTATNEARTSWTLQYQRAFASINSPETTALMHEYLLNKDFGHSAALVLAEHWRSTNEPNNDKQWGSLPDFSRIAERHATQISNPDVSSLEADAIFCAIEQLLNDASDSEKNHAVKLATVAASLPHGSRSNIIKRVIGIADRRQRNALLYSLVRSGKTIDVALVKQGIIDTFDAAQTQPWILTDQRELESWLYLLPYTNHPSEAFDVVQTLPEYHRTPNVLEKMLEAFGYAPSNDSENVLFRLAQANPRLYSHHAWCDALIRRGTLSSAMHLADLAAQGVFDHNGSTNQWHMSTHLAKLSGEYSELRAYIYDLVQNSTSAREPMLLVQTIVENSDEHGLVLLIQLEIERGRTFVSRRMIESVVTEWVPAENWENAYNVLPVPVVELRRRLLAMTTDGSPTDVATHYLNMIDEIRDEYGSPESEPRHPDLTSGKVWPAIALKSSA